ncbi:MAG: agmatinase [Candidatus Eisenbacteria bacterium]|nr:agmatinase [Candidatus Eisenbacteria bacterium]
MNDAREVPYPQGPGACFGGLPPELSDPAKARALILPVPYDGTTSYVPGTRRGPQAILTASQNVELYDEELEASPCDGGIATLPELDISDVGPEATVARVEEAWRWALGTSRFVVMLGGEHSLTPGAVRAAKERWPDLSVLQIDAHADLRNTYRDTPFSHACALRRVRESCRNVVQLGIRNLSAEEAAWVKSERIELGWGGVRKDPATWDRLLGTLSKHVFVTIDLDGLDPSVCPGVGTPEPGGIQWEELLRILRRVFSEREVVAADVMELCPLAGDIRSDFLAAKLVYKLVGYKFCLPRG